MAQGGYQGALAVRGTPMVPSGAMGEVWLTPLRSGYRDRKGWRAAKADMWLISPSLAARASCWCVKGNGDSQAASFFGSSRLRMLEILKDLCEGGDDVFGELAPLSEPRAGAGLVVETSGEPEILRPSPRLPTAEAGERLPKGEGDLLWAKAGLPRVMTLATS